MRASPQTDPSWSADGRSPPSGSSSRPERGRGSRRSPAIPGVPDVGILTSTEALALETLPTSLAVIGGRFVALELAQAFSRLGVRVTIVQRSGRILPDGDADVADELTRHLRDEGIEVIAAAAIAGVRRDGDDRVIDVRVGGTAREIRAREVLVATGRTPNTHDLGLAAAGVETDADGHVVVDDHLRTSAPHIYAAGDVKGAPAFVYAAAYEGRLAADNALGASSTPRDYRALPWVIFTDPQIAAVGLDERSAAAAGVAVDVAKVALGHVPRAIVARDERGFIKLIKRRSGDELLGAVIVAPEAGDLIMEPALAIRHGIGVSQLAAAFHPYLTQAEGLRLAAQAFSRDIRTLSCCAE